MRKIAIAAFAVVALLGTACGSDDSPSVDTDGATATTADPTLPSGPITIASFNFSESAILAHIYANALEAEGIETDVKANLGTREVVEPALEKGEVDLVPEYASTLLEFVNKGAGEASGDLAATLAKLNSHLEPKKLMALTASPAADQNAFAVTKATADKHKLVKTSDLATVGSQLVLGGPPECPTRPFCQPGLEKTYGITFKSFKPLDAGGPLTKGALEKGDIDVGLVFSSDGGVQAKNLVVLEDDKHLQNADNVVPVIRDEVASAKVIEILDKVSAALTTKDLIALNKRADIDKEDPKTLADEWAAGHGFKK